MKYLAIPLLFVFASACGGAHCLSLFEQIAACPCGNSPVDSDPYLGNDGCRYIQCAGDCSATIALITPRPFTSSMPLDGSLVFAITRATHVSLPSDRTLIKLTVAATGANVDGTSMLTSAERWTFTPSTPLAADTLYATSGALFY